MRTHRPTRSSRPTTLHLPFAGALRGALFAALVLAVAPSAWGAEDDDEFLGSGGGDEEGAAPKDDRSLWSWPTETRIDTRASTISLAWGGDAQPEVLSFDDVLRVERARAYEKMPDELFLRIADGRRVLVSRGNDAATHAILAKALTGFTLEVMPPGEGHFDPKNGGRSRPPALRIGPGDGIAYRAAKTTDLAMQGGRGAELRVVADDDHAALRGEGGGTLAKEQIDLVIKERMALYSRCYERELRRDARLAGKVVIRFVVDKDGSVKHAHLRATSLENSVVESCVVSEILQTRFPKPGGGTVVVSYPFNFQPR